MRVRVTLVVVTVLAGLGIPWATSVSQAGASATICSIETGAKVGAALGLKVTKASKDIQGSAVVCWYQVGANPHAAYVRVQTHDTMAGYQVDLKTAKTYQESPKSDSAFSPYPAFSTSIDSATYGYTYSVTVLKKTTEVAVGATGTTLSKVTTLAKKVLLLV
ncbi:MAG TPA: hypothetical protein VND83_03520 [Acidimicrobiales bacterium]|nr:hypothetical protein [Acidimicrobiales bacterium]